MFICYIILKTETMKHLFICFSIIYSVGLFAQSEYNHDMFNSYLFYSIDDMHYLIHPKSQLAENGVSSLTVQRTLGDSLVPQYIQKFDTSGNVVQSIAFNKKGEMTYMNTYDFSRYNKTYVKTNSKGKELKRREFMQDSITNQTQNHYYKNGKIISSSITSYISYTDESGETRYQPAKSEFFKKGKTTPQKVWEYTYYPNNTKKTSSISNKKGKVKKVWSYECKEEGELMASTKDTIKICNLRESDDDGLSVSITRNFDKKGRPEKTISKYKNNAMYSYEQYNKNDILVRKIIYSECKQAQGNFDINEFILYNNKGEETYRRVMKHDENCNTNEWKIYKKGDLQSSASFSFDESNNQTSASFFKKGQNFKNLKYFYNEKGLKIIMETIDLNKRKSKSTKLQYSYTYF